MKLHLSLFVVALSVLSLSILGCSKKKEGTSVLATVGARTITLGDLEDAYRKTPAASRPTEEGLKGLREFLETMIQKDLVAQAALDEIRELSDVQKRRLENRATNIVFEVLEKRQVTPSFEVTDAEIESQYQKQKMGYRPRHILVKSLADANQVLSLLNQGAVFEALAMQMSIDSKTYKDGGDLGYINIGQMPPAFDDALMKMKVGETVGPIKTDRGYHIIRLEDKREMDLPPINDDMRERLKMQVLARRALVKKNDFMEKAKKAMGVKYHAEAVRLLDRRFTALWANQRFLDDPASTGQPNLDASSWFPEFSDEDRSLPLVTIGDSTITIGDYIAKKIYAPSLMWPKGGGDEWVRENLDDTYYKDIAIAYGLSLGLRDDPEVRDRVALAREEMLVNTYYRNRVDTLSAPTEKEAWQYYQDNLPRYSLPDDFVQAALLHFNDKDAAVETLKRLKAGDNPDLVYKEMKERGVVTDWDTSATLYRSQAEAEIFDTCWKAEPGEFFGPIEIFGEFIVGNLAGKTPAGPIPWEYARQRVASDLLDKRKDDRLHAILDKLRERYPVKVNEPVLATSTLLKEMEQSEGNKEQAQSS
jgi:hypothetical protein